MGDETDEADETAGMGTEGVDGSGMSLESGDSAGADATSHAPDSGSMPPDVDDGWSSEGEPPDPTDSDGVPGEFFDDFDRTDADELGNGWFERNPVVFSLVGGRVRASMPAGPFSQTMVHRPPHESFGDVEVSVELHDLAPAVEGHPQLHLRLQLADAQAETMTGYVVWYIGGVEPTLAISRSNDDALTTTGAPLFEPLGGPLPHRLSARIEGADPVIVTATLEREDPGGWMLVGSVEMVDTDDERIRDPGPVGLAGDGSVTDYAFDNFWYTSPEGS